jgi:hypothetical protein
MQLDHWIEKLSRAFEVGAPRVLEIAGKHNPAIGISRQLFTYAQRQSIEPDIKILRPRTFPTSEPGISRYKNIK